MVLESAERDKCSHYKDLCQPHNFLPFVLSTFGFPGRCADVVLRRIVRDIAKRVAFDEAFPWSASTAI